ncbi:alpha/beta hydrolase [Halioglobus maricola]|uniref:Alpha/beta hydrolase n=1 Tax=Halioglobus maricola TaxID=2601894 RepID=A0A5P9NP70_9GAMM|nr:alpha/beta hydrolase [Halioglobus maricola]QFU77064.1 alpha/beta hydrolase [Halioglobus maricola]
MSIYSVNVRQGFARTPDGVRIAYQVSGRGPALVCCHAMGSDHTMYDSHRDRFSQANTFITFDQRGSGASDHPAFEEGPGSPYTVEKFGDDLTAVLDELGVESAIVLGFSMGAIPALSFSIRSPGRVSRLILASAMASRLPQPIIERARLVEDMLDRKGIGETYDFYFSGALFEGLMEQEEFRDRIAQARVRATEQGFKGCFRVTIDRPSLVHKLDAITCPTLILVGENDTHYLAEAVLLQEKIEDARRVVLPGVGHAMSMQDPGQFEAEVMAFIQ